MGERYRLAGGRGAGSRAGRLPVGASIGSRDQVAVSELGVGVEVAPDGVEAGFADDRQGEPVHSGAEVLLGLGRVAGHADNVDGETAGVAPGLGGHGPQPPGELGHRHGAVDRHPAVAPFDRVAQHGRAPAHPDGRMGPLERLGPLPALGEADMGAGEGGLGLSPQFLDGQGLLAPDGPAPAGVNPVVAHLVGVPAEPDPEDEPAAGKPVEGGRGLGQDDGVVLAHQAHAGAEPDG